MSEQLLTIIDQTICFLDEYDDTDDESENESESESQQMMLKTTDFQMLLFLHQLPSFVTN